MAVKSSTNAPKTIRKNSKEPEELEDPVMDEAEMSNEGHDLEEDSSDDDSEALPIDELDALFQEENENVFPTEPVEEEPGPGNEEWENLVAEESQDVLEDPNFFMEINEDPVRFLLELYHELAAVDPPLRTPAIRRRVPRHPQRQGRHGADHQV